MGETLSAVLAGQESEYDQDYIEAANRIMAGSSIESVKHLWQVEHAVGSCDPGCVPCRKATVSSLVA